MITMRLEEIWERPISCDAKRGPRGRVRCENDALHASGCGANNYHMHAGRGKDGRYFFW